MQWYAVHAAPCICVLSLICAQSQGAIKLVNAALSKYRGDQLLRALKAHALDRGGRTQEALVVSLPSPFTAVVVITKVPVPECVVWTAD
jgi:hypothetical protein